jgi:hypothetical protein
MLRSLLRILLSPGLTGVAGPTTNGRSRTSGSAGPPGHNGAAHGKGPGAAVPAAVPAALTSNGQTAAGTGGRSSTAELRRNVRGQVLVTGDLGYDEARLGHNRAAEYRPAVLVAATGAADVMAAVAYATDRELPVAVLNTGHTAAPPADGAVLVNTRRMQGVRVDPVARRARIEAGVRWEKVAHEAAAFGLAPLSGSAPEVGAVGYTLGGGLPLLGRSFGYAADHVRSIDVVTAHGALRQASPAAFDDLFWALRGGKGNFGVVTSLEIDLVPVPRIYGGTLVFPGRTAPEVTQGYRRWAQGLPEEMSSSLAYLRLPLGMDGPPELRGRFVVAVRLAHTGPAADGAELVRPLRRLGIPVLDSLREMPYTESGSIHSDPVEPFALAERTVCLGELTEDTVDALVDAAGPDTTCPLQLVELRQLGGALARQPEVPNCVGNRDAGFSLYTAAAAGPGVDEHAELIVDRLRPWHSGGKLLNFMGRNEPVSGPDGSAYSAADLERLGEVKRLYDPENMFRVNHNILPAVRRRAWA